MKVALITGITGQDGSYLAELLLSKGYRVHGIVRRASTLTTSRLESLLRDADDKTASLTLHYGDLADASGLRKIVEQVEPDEVYNLAAQSHVRVSFEQPEYTADVTGTGVMRLLEAIRDVVQRTGRDVRFYQAGTSEMFGGTEPPQNESTPFYPRSPYAAAKVAAHWYGVNYRQAYGLYVVNGILFNHESPRRGETFVTRKITRAVGRIKAGLQDELVLGNLDAKRDWGFAGDYVDAMWRMLQQDEPGDYVVATGQAHSVQDFVNAAFHSVDLDPQDFIKQDPRFMRPTEVHHLLGDPSKVKQQLGWEPQVNFEELVRMMVEHDLELARREKLLRDAEVNA
jgi:GDPmannose 4,6-dehydratase